MNFTVERLFEAAQDLPQDQRNTFLLQNCEDESLRREVELLLVRSEEHERFLQDAVCGAAGDLMQDLYLSPGAQLASYRILSLIGQGGMGTVYLAERADGKFEQRVAIKVLQAGSVKSSMTRLKQEYRVLASLEHPNIARVLDAGTTDQGLPYFVMEYVPGKPIDQFCEQEQLTIRDRLVLFLEVCDAVHFAHQNLIVHRDVKPDNILVGSQNQTKLLDFGIAKVLAHDAPSAQFTVTRMLTPEYASPEQIRGEQVATSTDTYSLGGVLYKLLTGVTPHQLADKSPAQFMHAICDENVRPSSELRPELAGDLDHILRMALRREPDRRYSSVEQFSADIRRYLDGQPVIASPDTLWYRAEKFVRRHWFGVTAISLVLITLSTGITLALWQARRAQRRFADVRRLANVFLFDFEHAIHDVAGATRARQLIVTTALEYLGSLSREASGDAGLSRELAAAYEKVGDIQGDPSGGNVGSTADAVASYQKALALRRSLGDADSRDVTVSVNFVRLLIRLSKVEARTADLDEAFRTCEEGLAVAQSTTDRHPYEQIALDQLAAAYSQMSFLKLRRNDPDGALEDAKRGVDLRKRMLDIAPTDRATRQSLADAYWAVGDLVEQVKQPSDAIPYYEKSLPIYEQLAGENQSNISIRRQLMIVLAELGRDQVVATPSSQHARDAGIANLRRSYSLANEAVDTDRANAEAVSDLAAICVRLGDSLSLTGHRAEGAKVLERGVQAATDLVKRDPESRNDRVTLALTHSWLGNFLADGGDLAVGLRHREVAAEIYAKLAAENPTDSKILSPQVWNWLKIGDLFAKRHDWVAARRNYSLGLQVAEKMAPKSPMFNDVLANLRRSDQKALQALASRN